MKEKAVLLLVQRCHCWFKTILFLLPLVQNDSLLYYLLPGTGRFCIASYRTAVPGKLVREATRCRVSECLGQSSFFGFNRSASVWTLLR